MKSEYAVKVPSILLRKALLASVFYPLSDQDAGQLIKGLVSIVSGEEVSFDDTRMMTLLSVLTESVERSAMNHLQKIMEGVYDKRGAGRGDPARQSRPLC